MLKTIVALAVFAAVAIANTSAFAFGPKDLPAPQDTAPGFGPKDLPGPQDTAPGFGPKEIKPVDGPGL